MKPRKLIGTNRKIDENLHHRQKVINRKREIMKIKIDEENEQLLPQNFQGTHHRIKGYKPSKPIKIWSKIFKIVGIMFCITVGYVIIINVWGI